MAKKLIAVMVATSHEGKVEMALPTITATPIFNMKASAIPHRIGTQRYRVASTPVV